jgi:hypothetical protein
MQTNLISLFLESKSASRYDQQTSTMNINLTSPIHIPHDAKNCRLKVVQSDIWNLVSNVSPALGDQITVDPGGTGTNIQVLTIPDGQYSVESLNSALSNQLVLVGLASTILQLGGDAPTQKTKFSTSSAGTIISFPTTASLYNILGFNLGDTLTLTTANVFYLAPKIARFNSINTFLIHSDLVDVGIPVNGNYYGVIAKVPITVASGSLIPFSPPYPISVTAASMIGSRIQSLSFWLTSEDGFTRVNTRENYSVLLEVAYDY